jgi:hypothetical protein
MTSRLSHDFLPNAFAETAEETPYDTATPLAEAGALSRLLPPQ